VRLNGTSDILWERESKPPVMDLFPKVRFYDYTKAPLELRKDRPPRYHLTFSRGAYTSDTEIARILATGVNVAVVFAPSVPKAWKGFRVIDGDKSDLRFLDPKGVIVGLEAKGKARKDRSGFVVWRA
jgi:hypothetical protein